MYSRTARLSEAIDASASRLDIGAIVIPSLVSLVRFAFLLVDPSALFFAFREEQTVPTSFYTYNVTTALSLPLNSVSLFFFLPCWFQEETKTFNGSVLHLYRCFLPICVAVLLLCCCFFEGRLDKGCTVVEGQFLMELTLNLIGFLLPSMSFYNILSSRARAKFLFSFFMFRRTVNKN